jgi:hypothetical protein
MYSGVELDQSQCSMKCGSKWPTFAWMLTYHPTCIYVQVYRILQFIVNEKAKFEIATAKRRNRNHFSILRFNLFRFSALAYSRLFFCIFASSRVAEWSRRWTLKPRCRHRCGFDPHVCQGFKAPSLAQGFADFPAWNIGFLPPQDWWPCENPISVKQSFILPSENLPLSLPYLHIRVVSSTYD